MSQTVKSLIASFDLRALTNSGKDFDIPDDNGSGFKKGDEERIYRLDIDPKGKVLNPSFVRLQPKNAPWCNEGSLEICAHRNCSIEIQLSSRWNWVFPDGAIKTRRKLARYVNLRKAPGGQSVKFYSKRYASGPTSNKDLFNIYVLIDMGTDKGAALLKIDPDIKNPGDHPGKGGQ